MTQRTRRSAPGGLWLLAIESASERASVALLRGGEPVASRPAPPGRPASETLLPTVLALLEAHGLAPGTLAGIAVSIGPGSFTGLRVGAATAKGLAFGATSGVAAVPTLAALAAKGIAAVGSAPQVVAVLDARRGELYAAAHHGDDPLAKPLWGPGVIAVEALAERLAAEPGPLLVVGECADAVAAALGPSAAGRVRCLPPPEGAPDAAWVGRLGARLLAAGEGLAAADLAPVYVRRAEAEVRRLGG
jgi:tRNA threonylcarbamoyladenosine biosynthesis protein TsaB